MAVRRKARRGLAALSPARRKRIAEKGAAALHAKNAAHKFTSTTGRAAANLRHHGPEPPDEGLSDLIRTEETSGVQQ